MNGKIEDLFSPERLKGSWEGIEESQTSTEKDPAPDSRAEHPKALVLKLRRLIDERYPEGEAEPVKKMMSELERIFSRRFPDDGDKSLSPDDKSALNADIEQVLIGMDDLVDALNVGHKKR